MTWNYRVFETNAPTPEDDPPHIYKIVEAYYDDNGNVEAVTVDGMAPQGDTVDELKADLGLMLLALDKPVLTEADVPGERTHLDLLKVRQVDDTGLRCAVHGDERNSCSADCKWEDTTHG